MYISISRKPTTWLVFAALISVALVMSLFGSCATMVGSDLTPDQARVVEIVECPGIDKDRLFVLANTWAVDAFVSAESVIQYSDKEAGIVKGKYIISFIEWGFFGSDPHKVSSTLLIEVKDGAARITIVTYDPTISEASFNKHCLPEYHNLIASFRKAMQEPGGAF